MLLSKHLLPRGRTSLTLCRLPICNPPLTEDMYERLLKDAFPSYTSVSIGGRVMKRLRLSRLNGRTETRSRRGRERTRGQQALPSPTDREPPRIVKETAAACLPQPYSVALTTILCHSGIARLHENLWRGTQEVKVLQSPFLRHVNGSDDDAASEAMRIANLLMAEDDNQQECLPSPPLGLLNSMSGDRSRLADL